jgi:hypothetical protein
LANGLAGADGRTLAVAGTGKEVQFRRIGRQLTTVTPAGVTRPEPCRRER